MHTIRTHIYTHIILMWIGITESSVPFQDRDPASTLVAPAMRIHVGLPGGQDNPPGNPRFFWENLGIGMTSPMKFHGRMGFMVFVRVLIAEQSVQLSYPK